MDAAGYKHVVLGLIFLKLVDDAMAGIERDNRALKGVLPKDYDRFPDLKADFILANPPFNVSDRHGELLREDKRWQYGVPPVGNANFAWVQHIVHQPAPASSPGTIPVQSLMKCHG